MFEWVDADENSYRFAVELDRQPVRLCLRLRSDPPAGKPPALRVCGSPPDITLSIQPIGNDGLFEVGIGVAPAPAEAGEDELAFTVAGDVAGLPECRVVLRRTSCRISIALVQREPASAPLRPQTRAALLWHSWGRYSEVVGLKRFTSGMSGSDVLVFRPRLRRLVTEDPAFVAPEPLEVLSQAWGSCLLIKTGELEEVRDEWDRFRLFLSDRLHPFMTRSETYLTVRLADGTWDGECQASMIGAFLGSDLVQAEPFESVLRGPSRPEEIERILHRVFAITGTWYLPGVQASLGNWWKMFTPARAPDGAPSLRLLGGYDLTQEQDRGRFVAWDVAFSSKEHMVDHLLGTDRPGLVHRLMELPARYSLIHGDLHPRNILVDASNVTLLDFGRTGVGPTLFDFARLEVFVRLWCLDLAASVEGIEEYGAQLETLLLDHFTATEGSMEPVRRIAAHLEIEPEDLVKIARCIAAIRRHALPYCLGTPDRRDYLAVLYMSVFRTLRFAGHPSEPLGNFRWLMALFWVLEDALSRIVGMEPFPRDRLPVRPERLLGAEWLAGPGAPQRVLYWLDRPDGRKALEPLAATRGFLQGPEHHLDVFDHTLLTLAYLEEILDDPVEALLDPHALDLRVRKSLKRQGITLPPVRSPGHPAIGRKAAGRAAAGPVDDWVRPCGEEIRPSLEACLTGEARLILKGVALFHDVGKPSMRAMVRDAGEPGWRTMFDGHELYGLQLVAEHLRALFPAEQPFETAADLYRRQNLHEMLVHRYQGAKRLNDLKRGLAAGALPPREREYLRPLFGAPADPRVCPFPLLILLGFADRLASRGPAVAVTMDRVAEIDLALLALSFRHPLETREG